MILLTGGGASLDCISGYLHTAGLNAQQLAHMHTITDCNLPGAGIYVLGTGYLGIDIAI